MAPFSVVPCGAWAVFCVDVVAQVSAIVASMALYVPNLREGGF